MQRKIGLVVSAIIVMATIGGVWGSGVLNHPTQTTTTTTTSPYCPVTSLPISGSLAYTASNATLSIPLQPNQDVVLARWTIGANYQHPTESGTFPAGTHAGLVELSPVYMNVSTEYYVVLYDTCPTQDSFTIPYAN